MSLVLDVFEKGFNVYAYLTQKSKSKNKNKRLLLRELRDNMKRLELREKRGVNHELLISHLQNEQLEESMNNGFDLNSLAKGTFVDKEIVNMSPHFQKYLGWDCEKLMLGIDGKIVALKELFKLIEDVEKSNINVKQRLGNLYVQCVLVSLLVKSSMKKS